MGILATQIAITITNKMKIIESFKRIKMAFIFLVLGMAATAGLSSKAFAAAGDLFVSDIATNSIIVYHPDGTKFTFATGLNAPFGLGFDAFGNLYEADSGTGQIFKFRADGTRSLYASGLRNPQGLAFEGDRSDFFVTQNSATKGRIERFDLFKGNTSTYLKIAHPSGVFYHGQSVFIANGTSEVEAPEPENSPTSTMSTGDNSVDIVVNHDQSIFVSTTAGTILKLAGEVKTTFASGLFEPSGMAFDHIPDGGHLFVAERGEGGRITEITPKGIKTTFATGGSPNKLAFQPVLNGKLANISTRGHVLTGENVLIAGFIIPGNTPKRVLLRGLGPSLASAETPVPGPLANPVLELHKPDGTVVSNDNWQSTQEGQIQATGLAPKNHLESAILATLLPGSYTAIERGRNNGEGVALVEVYDLDPISAASELGNISTRGFTDTGDNVLIGGFIIHSSDQGGSRVVVRAIGPSLANATPPVTNALANPTLQLVDSNGTSIVNDDWMQSHQAAIEATGLAPTDARESAILTNLVPGPYTAIVRGKNGTTGVALVEVYRVP
jgi:hypothetical protein